MKYMDRQMAETTIKTKLEPELRIKLTLIKADIEELCKSKQAQFND